MILSQKMFNFRVSDCNIELFIAVFMLVFDMGEGMTFIWGRGDALILGQGHFGLVFCVACWIMLLSDILMVKMGRRITSVCIPAKTVWPKVMKSPIDVL